MAALLEHYHKRQKIVWGYSLPNQQGDQFGR